MTELTKYDAHCKRDIITELCGIPLICYHFFFALWLRFVSSHFCLIDVLFSKTFVSNFHLLFVVLVLSF